MGPVHKRKHTEVAGGAAGTGTGGHDTRHSKKPRTHFRKGNPKNATQNGPKGDSTSVLKNRIRNLKRLLSHVDNDTGNKMPANIRIERERELETCEHELEEKQTQQRETDFRNKIIGRYHHIRFFERQRATRNIKRLQKQHAALEDTSDRAELRQALHNAEVDLNYTIYYPLLKPYVSIFPNAKKNKNASTGEDAASVENGSGSGPRGNIEMWKAVEKAMEDRTLEALRNSREGVTIPGPKKAKGDKAKKDGRHEEKKEKKQEKKQKQESKSAAWQGNGAADEEEDEDSDGGFFE